MANTFDNVENAFCTDFTKSTVPRWQRKAMESFDRFIPNRTSMNIDESHFHLTSERDCEDVTCSPSKADYQRNMKNNLGQDQSSKILAFKNKAPKPAEGFQNDLPVMYSQNKTARPNKVSRHIPQTPDRILDAPELQSDYYLNLIDWSSTNMIAVALGQVVYLWDAASGEINELCALPEADYVASVNWLADGSYLAVGTKSSAVQIWDVQAQKKVRTMGGQQGRVGSLAWNEHILSSGAQDGSIFNHDVRIQNHHIATLSNHTQEVCGLKWSCDGKMLASGGNDNVVSLWNANNTLAYSLTDHQAAVKALAWCPWQSNLLATGGGSADRHIRFWNTATGACVNAIDTKSQVCSLLWNKEYKEIISGHGYSQNQLTIWKYPTMTKVTELTGHTERVLSMAMSPDGTTVVSAAGDETLRFWKCFASDAQKKQKKVAAPTSRLTEMIR